MDIENVEDNSDNAINTTICFSLEDATYIIENQDFILREILTNSQDIINWCLLFTDNKIVDSNNTKFYTMMKTESLVNFYLHTDKIEVLNPKTQKPINIETDIISFGSDFTTKINQILQQRILYKQNQKRQINHYGWGLICGIVSLAFISSAFLVAFRISLNKEEDLQTPNNNFGTMLIYSCISFWITIGTLSGVLSLKNFRLARQIHD
ncbi:MAG: hypothetical protein ACK5Z5_06905 [Neisseriaceae bacterium]